MKRLNFYDFKAGETLEQRMARNKRGRNKRDKRHEGETRKILKDAGASDRSIESHIKTGQIKRKTRRLQRVQQRTQWEAEGKNKTGDKKVTKQKFDVGNKPQDKPQKSGLGEKIDFGNSSKKKGLPEGTGKAAVISGAMLGLTGAAYTVSRMHKKKKENEERRRSEE